MRAGARERPRARMAHATAIATRSRRDPIGLDRVVEVFVRAFTYTRSFTHPYLAQRVGPLWVMRDAPRTSGDWRTEEWVAHGGAPAEIDRIARRHTRGRFALCVICGSGEPDAPMRADFKSLGYRLRATEPMMVHRRRRMISPYSRRFASFCAISSSRPRGP